MSSSTWCRWILFSGTAWSTWNSSSPTCLPRVCARLSTCRRLWTVRATARRRVVWFATDSRCGHSRALRQALARCCCGLRSEARQHCCTRQVLVREGSWIRRGHSGYLCLTCQTVLFELTTNAFFLSFTLTLLAHSYFDVFFALFFRVYSTSFFFLLCDTWFDLRLLDL